MTKGRGRELKDLAGLFLKLGLIGFGGPAVHISLMEQEVVVKRKWMSAEHFLDLIGATNLIPGPNSTEMTMHIGHERAGWRGLVVAGSCFILPAVLITALFAWAYARYGELPEVQPFLYGIKPAIISVIAATMVRLGKKAIKNWLLASIGLMAALATLAGLNEIYVLFGAGFLGMALQLLKNRSGTRLNLLVPFAFTPLQAAGRPEPGFCAIFLIFLKVGSILYGSGYVLFAFLDAELVAKGLLSSQQLIDAIAVGQFTPGPVFSSATFIGYQIAGLPGAAAATIGIFLPSFLFVAFLNPLIPKLRRSPLMSAFLDSVNVVSVAVILAVMLEMGTALVMDWKTILIALISLAVTWFFKNLNSAFIILGGAAAGYILHLLAA